MKINFYYFFFYIFLLGLLICELCIKNNFKEYSIDNFFAFYAIIGFLSSFIFVYIAKILRKILIMDKKYYE